MAAEKPKTGKDDYIVERIDGVKIEDDVLKFFVIWEGYPLSESTFEEYGNVKDCIQFQIYIDNLRFHLQSEIDLNAIKLKNKLGPKIIDTLKTKPKNEIIKDLEKLDNLGFDAFEVLYHILPPNEKFYALYEELFELNYYSEMLRNQEDEFEAFVLDINKDEPMTIRVENDIDFSIFKKFHYISENIWMQDPLNDFDIGSPDSTGIDTDLQIMPPYKQPLTLFKTPNMGWGVKTMTKIKAGGIIMECVGEVYPEKLVKSMDDKKFLFPVPIKVCDQFYFVNAARSGNLSRFVNHRCFPNSRIKSVCCSSISLLKNKLVMFATRDIPAGEEITIDYTYDCDIYHGIKCLCDSGRCLDNL